MAATDETTATATAQPDAKPGSATGETVLVTVDEAAELFGISPQAVRKRLSKGHLNGRKDAHGQWQILLERETVATAESATNETDAQPRTKPDAQPRNLVAAAQAEQMAALVASIQAPLLDRIEEANRSLERERVQRETAERERDELRAEVELLREIRQSSEPQDENRPNAADASPEAPGRELPDEGLNTPEHAPSWLLAAWQRLRGRS